jgi:hypothetical protein
MWSGLGVNYKSSQANWASDIAYFKRIGLTTIRPHLSGFPTGTYTPGSEIAIVGSIDWWRTCAQTFVDEGFTVVHGVAREPAAVGAFTADVWETHRTKVLQDAAYCQSLGLALHTYQIGNEIEGRIDGTTLTQTQLIANLKSLAAEVKAVYPLAQKIGYSAYDPGGTFLDLWISAGLGDLDVLGLNLYAQTTASGSGFIFGDMAKLGKMIKAFGPDRVNLTEFGIDANATQYNLAPQYNRNYIMRHIYAGIRELGFTTAIAYSYVGYLDGDNDFALKNTDGTFDIQWGVLLSDGGYSTITETGANITSVRLPFEGNHPIFTGTLPLRAPSARPVFQDGRGNLAPMALTPTDMTPLRIGSTSDFSVVFKGILFPKRGQGNTSSHTIARCEYFNATDLGYLFQVTNSTGRLRVLTGSTTYDSNASSVPYDTEVTIVFTLSGSTLRGYVNGTLVTWFTSGTTSQTVTRKAGDANDNNFFLAEIVASSTASAGLMGRIYEIGSVREALSAGQINNIALGVWPTMDIRYDLTRGAGRWTADLSGNNNHGLLGVERWGSRV